MTHHLLTRTVNTTWPERPGMFSAAEEIRIGLRSYAVGGWDETEAQRTVQDGPMVQGPQAYAFALAVVIAAHPIPNKRPVVEAELGDTVRLDGVTYTIEPAPNRNIRLVPVAR